MLPSCGTRASCRLSSATIKPRPMSPMSCILQGKSLAFWPALRRLPLPHCADVGASGPMGAEVQAGGVEPVRPMR